MKETVVLLAFAALALAGSESSSVPGPTRLMSGTGTLSGSGITVRFATYAIPGGDWSKAYGGGGIEVSKMAIHRDILDSTTGAYFGYDLAFSGDASNGYQAVFLPLSNLGEHASIIQPKYPPPQPIKDGDTIALDLMSSPDESRKIVDYLQISLRPPEPSAVTSNAQPRDFTIDDGAVNYDFSEMTIWVNGQKYSGMRAFTGKPGATFWIAPPGQGRYVLSLAPHEDFVKSGVIRENVLSFEDGGQQYELRFMSPVAGAGKAWNLYVLHDSAYEPKPELREAISCGTDRLENLLPSAR